MSPGFRLEKIGVNFVGHLLMYKKVTCAISRRPVSPSHNEMNGSWANIPRRNARSREDKIIRTDFTPQRIRVNYYYCVSTRRVRGFAHDSRTTCGADFNNEFLGSWYNLHLTLFISQSEVLETFHISGTNHKSFTRAYFFHNKLQNEPNMSLIFLPSSIRIGLSVRILATLYTFVRNIRFQALMASGDD